MGFLHRPGPGLGTYMISFLLQWMPGGITSMARISPKLMTWAVDLTHLHLLLVSRLSSDSPAPQQPTSRAQTPAGGGQTGTPPPCCPQSPSRPPTVPFSGAHSREGQKQAALEGARLKQGSSLPRELPICLSTHLAGLSFNSTDVFRTKPAPCPPAERSALQGLEEKQLNPAMRIPPRARPRFSRRVEKMKFGVQRLPEGKGGIQKLREAPRIQ